MSKQEKMTALGGTGSKKLILPMIIIMLFMCISCVSAETINIGDYVVAVEQNECFNIPYSCDNCTFVNISIIAPNGTIIADNVEMSSASGFLYNYSFCETSDLGRYFVSYHYDDNGMSIYSDMDWFQVTPNGENATEGKAIFYIGLLAVLLFFLAFSIFGFVSFENLLARVGLFGLSYLLLIAVTFIGWNMANDFLLSSIFVAEMFRILFFVLIIGAFPLLIGAFAWYLIMLFRIKEIERLMNKGLSRDEAEHRQRNKYRGKR